MGQISFNLVKKASATWQLAFLPPASRFTTFWLRHAKKSKFWDKKIKWPTSFQVRLLYCFNTFLLFLFPFSFLFTAVTVLLMGLLAVKKNFKERVCEMSKFYHGVATCNDRKFCSRFFTQLFVHISGVFRLSTLIWVLLERSFPPAEVEYRWWQFWSKVMMSEVEGQGSSRPAQESVGWSRLAKL